MSDQQQTMSCPVCKAPMDETLQAYKVEVNGQEVLVEDVPTWVCEQCEYTLVEDQVIDAVEDMLAHMDEVAEEE